jgi:hypothetical protein
VVSCVVIGRRMLIGLQFFNSVIFTELEIGVLESLLLINKSNSAYGQFGIRTIRHTDNSYTEQFVHRTIRTLNKYYKLYYKKIYLTIAFFKTKKQKCLIYFEGFLHT